MTGAGDALGLEGLPGGVLGGSREEEGRGEDGEAHHGGWIGMTATHREPQD